jgi:hypothetical protein
MKFINDYEMLSITTSKEYFYIFEDDSIGLER